MKQKIEIEVPEGKVAVWDKKMQKITFKDIESWKEIKTFDDVLKYLEISRKEFETVQNSQIPVNKWQLIMEAFLEASNDQCKLTEGPVYYPYCYIVWEDKASQFDRIGRVKDCIINNRNAFLVGGGAPVGSYAGLCFSNSHYAAAFSYAPGGFSAFSSHEVAKHVSKYFAFELFESTVGWRTDEIKWL